jgi:outer membrane receptor protein involved in Fe transport
VTVGSRPPAPLRITLQLAAIAEEVSVGTGDRVSTGAASNLDAPGIDSAGIENLPVFDQDVVGTISRFLDASAIGTNGPVLLVNGIEVNNLNFSASAIQQIKINQDPYSVEYSRPGRGRIDIVLKPGTLEYHGTANAFMRDAALDATNAFAAVKPPEQRRIFEGFLGGPVRRSTSNLFNLSLRANAEDTQAIVFAEGPGGAIRQNVAAPYRNVLAAGSLSHKHSEKTTITVTATYQDQTRHNQDVGGVTLPSAGSNWHFLEQTATYIQQTVLSPALFEQLRVFVGQEFETGTSVSAAPKVVVLDAFTGGGAQSDFLRTEHHAQGTAMLVWSPQRHTIKFGIQVPDLSRRRLDDNTNSGGTFYFSSLSDYAGGRPFSFVQQAGNGHVAFLEKVVGAFVQDEIHLDPRLTATLGLRYDWQGYFHDTNNFGPRGSIAFAPASDGRTVIRGGAGLFYDRSGPRPIQELIRYNGIRQVRYVVTDPRYPNPFEPLPAIPAPGIVRLAPGTGLPMTLQFSAAVERQLAPRTMFSIAYTGTRGFDQFLSRDINAPEPPLFESRPDPAYGVIRDIESTGTLMGHSVQFMLRHQAGRTLNLSAQYTLSKTRNDTSGITWMPPNAYDLSLEYARADFDQRHKVDLLATFAPRSWFNVGAALALYSGRPYSMTTGTDLFHTGQANARPPGVRRNSLDGPGYADLDLRWSRDVAFGRGRPESRPSLTVGIDAFNVLNRVNPTGYVGTLTSPFFGAAVAAQPPRRLQFSIRTKF